MNIAAVISVNREISGATRENGRMTMGTGARSLELYFIDGKPDGMLTAEVFNWTGHVLVFPRTRVSAALSRIEASHTGVYILLGEREGESTAYVGEGENIRDRLTNHGITKDWWSKAVLITSAGNKLNKAHVKYLESRLVQEARRVGRVELDNSITPLQPGLSEADRANMESFLDTLLMVLPALRIDLFLGKTRPSIGAPGDRNGVAFELFSKKHGVRASAILENDEFVVEAGSMARLEWQKPDSKTAFARKHAELKARGILRAVDGHCVFKENYAFSGPVEAASVVCGRPAAGTVEWKRKGSGESYKEWEYAQLRHDGSAGVVN
jgi:hypothetical protein